MNDWLRFLGLRRGQWRLQGYDMFAGHWYDLPGRYRSEARAQRAARTYLVKLNFIQPPATSGGQRPGAIQDQVYIISPEGKAYRYWPDRKRG
jgi:hypothetical protein